MRCNMEESIKKTDKPEQISIRKPVSLGKIPDTEQWLNHMAAQGFVLTKIEGRTFCFEPNHEEPVSYFMLSPETGANNSAWIYYEFLENGGIRIPHSGTSFLSPDLVLKIPNQKYQENEQLYRYYFMHRNYRMIHRLVSNIILSMMFFFLCIIVFCMDSHYMFSLLCICFGSLFVGLDNAMMLFHFTKSCRMQGLPAMWNRPRRPGY